MHNIIDIFDQHLKETEERIIAAIQHHEHEHHEHPTTAGIMLKSYRIADRQNENE